MFDAFDEFQYLFEYVWSQGPILLVWLAGIIWAVLTWKRNPRKSLLTSLALVAFLLETVGLPFVYRYLIDPPGTGSPEATMRVYRLVAFAHSGFNAVLWLLLLAAIFLVDRKPPAPRGPDGELLPPDLHPGRAESS